MTRSRTEGGRDRPRTAGAARVSRGAAVLAVLGWLVGPGAAAADDVAPFAVSIPTVTGPIPSTDASFGFGVEGFDVQPPVPDGYVVEEYFFSGTGNLYEYTPTGIRVVSPCPPEVTQGCTDIPYTTRMVVKRPKRRRDFSGTVVVEPLNPSAGFDIAAVWDRSRDYFVRNGDVFVGWSSKSVIVDALKGFDPTRYAPLQWTYEPFEPGGNSGVYDGLTFDIAAQIGALFKQNGPGSPLHGFRVKRVFEAGFSQDGGFTFTQADVFHAIERMPHGGPIYDGYVPMGTNGPSNVNFGLTPAGALPLSDPRHRMQPRDVPVIHANTETEVFIGTLVPGGLLYRRPDSDAPDDRLRIWEVPGGAHVSNDLRDDILTLELDRAQIEGVAPEDLEPNGCAHQAFQSGPVRGIPGVVSPSPFPFSYVENAAFRAITVWSELGIPPPHAEPIAVDTGGPVAVIVRDAFGNATGGVRTPFLDVPTATWVPFDSVATPTATSGFCILYGYEVPFDEAQLGALYRSRASYLVPFVGDTLKLVGQRFWLLPDALDAIGRALEVDIP